MKNFRLLAFASLVISLFIWSCTKSEVAPTAPKVKRSAHVNPIEIAGIDHNNAIEYAMNELDLSTASFGDIHTSIKDYFINNTTDQSIVTALQAITFADAESKIGNDNFGTVSEYFAINPNIYSSYIRNNMDDVEAAITSASNLAEAENALIDIEADVIADNNSEKDKALGGLAVARHSLNLWADYFEDNGDSTFDEEGMIDPRLLDIAIHDYFAYMGELEGQGGNTNYDDVIRLATNQAAFASLHRAAILFGKK
jgi:hypothetical protein